MRQIYETIDRQGYQWVVVLVAGLGFFLDGYTVSEKNVKSGLSEADMGNGTTTVLTVGGDSFSPVTWPFR